jgi:hypothetical protein
LLRAAQFFADHAMAAGALAAVGQGNGRRPAARVFGCYPPPAWGAPTLPAGDALGRVGRAAGARQLGGAVCAALAFNHHWPLGLQAA